MSQARVVSRHWVPPSYGQGATVATAPEADARHGPLASGFPGTTEQTEFNSSAAIQVGHQLAVIGDEFNRMYDGKTPVARAPVWSPTFSFVQMGVLSIFRSVAKCLSEPMDSSWMRRLAARGHQVPVLPASTVYQKGIPVALLLILFGLVVNYGLPN